MHPAAFPAYWQHELQWLDQDLAAAVRRTRFQVVVMHQPPFHSKTSRVYPEYADPEFRDDIMPLMDKYGVEFVVSGHDAHNVRSYPLNAVPTPDWNADKPKLSPKVVAPGKGTVYLEQSTTGKNYDGLLDAEPWVAWSQSQSTMPAVLLFNFGKDTISAKFVRTDVLDESADPGSRPRSAGCCRPASRSTTSRSRRSSRRPTWSTRRRSRATRATRARTAPGATPARTGATGPAAPATAATAGTASSR